MTLDWCPGIREACAHWRDAPILQQTFEAMERNTYSHAGAIADPEHDLSLLAETQPVLRDTLEMMMAVDREHYDGLLKLVAAQRVEEQGEP